MTHETYGSPLQNVPQQPAEGFAPPTAMLPEQPGLESPMQLTAEIATETALTDYATQRETWDPQHAEGFHKRAEVSPRHHAEHLELAAFVPDIETRPAADQDLIGEVIELGGEAIPAGNNPMPSESEGSRPNGLHGLMEEVGKRNEPIIAAAKERSAYIETPETSEAIAGYYNDHEKILTAVEQIAAGNVSSTDALSIEVGQVEPTMQHEIFEKAYKDMVTMAAEGDTTGANQLALDLLDACCDEVSLGAMTLSDDMITATAERVGLLKQRLGETGSQLTEIAANRLQTSREQARGEVRNAGQLLFHNTVYGGDIADSSFQLMGRSMQTEVAGKTNAATEQAAGISHTNVVHFSELYDPWGYKVRISTNTPGQRETVPVTFALPIAEVINKAPFGRNLRYGVLEAKPDTKPQTVTTAANGAEVGYIGPGGADMPHAGLSTDRVFLADNHSANQLAAHNYVIDCGVGAMKYNPQTRQEESVAYAITTALDAQKSGLNGAGYGYPTPVFITESTGKLGTELEAAVAPTIQRLQIESRSRAEYANKYVVPLRGMVMEFVDEGGNYATRNSLQRRYASTDQLAMRGGAIAYA